ncbi:MAG: hypothetical protein JRI80_00360 [Deltaproteobacteria bacterium]|nr:hypothetical protein [Deltaproteobacteria bacterium]
MSKMWQVFRRFDNDPRWYKCELGLVDNVRFYGDGVIFVYIGGDACNAVMLRDIDPENIPDNVRCVVCEQVTDELCG